MKILSIESIMLLFLISCAQSGYQKFYNPYLDTSTLTEVELLQPGQDPQVFGTDDFERDIRILRAKQYLVVGCSSFNGEYEDTKNAISQAKRIGATVVLVNSKYTNTQTSTSALFLPKNQRTYHSGTVYGGGIYGNYQGASNTYGNTVVPYTIHQRRYDQTAAYLVRSTRKMEFGIFVDDLTPTQRSDLERNLGAFVDLVIEDTPAFYSNLISGDVIIEIDGMVVKNGKHAVELLQQAKRSSPTSVLTIIRKGVEIELTVTF